MPTALITGPTSGIGNAFARRLAADGWDLVLVSRDEARLEKVAAGLRESSGRDVEVLAADLTDPAARAAVAERLADAARPVDLLVNNAGSSTPAGMLETSLAAEAATLEVLVKAVLELSKAAAPAMVARGRGGIINVSSVSGYLPRGTYGAAKAWVTAFSRSLSRELAGTGVRVLATCPGLTRTEFHDRGGFDLAKVPNFMWLSADDVVDDALRALAAGRDVTVPGRQWKAVIAVSRHLPIGALLRATRHVGRPR